MADTGVCHDWLEDQPPKVSNSPGYYCATRLPDLNPMKLLAESISVPHWQPLSSVRPHANWVYMHHGPGFISSSRNLSCLATMWRLLLVIGRVIDNYLWLTNWGSETWFLVSCPMRVRWFLNWFPASTHKCTLIGHVGSQPPTAEEYSDTWGFLTPDQGF